MLDFLVDGIDVCLQRVFEREISATILALMLDPFVNIADMNSLLVRSREFSAADLALANVLAYVIIIKLTK